MPENALTTLARGYIQPFEACIYQPITNLTTNLLHINSPRPSLPGQQTESRMDSSHQDPHSTKESSSGIANYYRTNPKRLGLLGHISFGVQSYTRSKSFYNAILAPLGVHLVYDNATRGVLGYGFEEGYEIINIFECKEGAAHPPGDGNHVALNAPSRAAVREFWEAGVRNGGVDRGGPGLRKDYGDFYYAAFLLDPDGFKLEVVFQDEVVEEEP